MYVFSIWTYSYKLPKEETFALVGLDRLSIHRLVNEDVLIKKIPGTVHIQFLSNFREVGCFLTYYFIITLP